MLKKASFLLLAAVLAVSYCSAQTHVDGYDTVTTGCTYLVNPQTFEIKSGYLQRVAAYTWDYQPVQGQKQNADTVSLAKTKKYIAVSYYVIKDLSNKKTWVKVQEVQDFNVNFTLK